MHATEHQSLDPLMFFMQSFTAFAHFIASRCDQAWPLEEARKCIARALQLDPELRISNLKDRVRLIRPDYFTPFVEALRQAGLPE